MTATGSNKADSLRRNKQFQLIWGGSAASALGSNVSVLAYPLLVLALTGSPGTAGVVSAVALASELLFSLPAGVWADRWDRRRVLLSCEVVRAVLVGSVAVAAYLDSLTLTHIIVVAATEDAAGTLFSPARELTIRSIVKPDQLTAAYSQEHARAYGAELAGQPLGGLLFTISSALPFVADAFSYAVSAMCIVLAKVPRRGAAPVEPTHGRSMRADVVEAARWLWNEQFLRALCLVALLTNLGSSMLLLPLIVLIQERDGTPATVGAVIGAASVGGLIGAIIAGRVAARVPLYRLLLAVCVVDAVLILAVIAPLGPYWPAVPMFLAGVFGPLLSIPLQVHVARHSPESMMARVQSMVGTSFSAFVPLGPIIGGFLAEGIGPMSTIAITAGVFGVSALGVLFTPALRRRDPSASSKQPDGLGQEKQ